ncbi:MAG: LarC family nickel insertion protein [Deltaproteobacteria bacterium]|nr:LarC family nickel insertion protein [Deltaproteobacteria bacterium]
MPKDKSSLNEHEHHAGHAHGNEHEHHAGHAHEPEHSHARRGSILTVRACSGLSGDIIVSALAKLADLSREDINGLTEELKLPALKDCLRLEARSVKAIYGWGCKIILPDEHAHEHTHRNMADIERIIQNSDFPDAAKNLSIKAFYLLAEAEGAVHGKKPEEVTFHEVGALDSILDICLSCRIFTLLAPEYFICSPLPMADGAIYCAHGCIPSPAPAVLRLLTGIPVRGFAGEGETVTPTALSLLKALGASFGSWPEFTVQKTLISYGDKIFPGLPNGAIWALGVRAV